MIELELNLAKETENNSTRVNGRQQRSLKRDRADDHNEEPVSKRQRQGGGNDALSNRRTRASIALASSQEDSSTLRPPQDTIGGGRATKRRRYSGQTSIAEPLSIQPERSKPEGSAAQVLKPRKRQAKVYQKERESRRIAGYPPQFGMLPKRGEPYTPPSRYPSNTRKPNPSSPRSHASSKKKSIAVKGATPQGISKSRRETKRSKRSKKRSRG